MKCQSGIVYNALVPAITYCQLNLKDNYDNSRGNLGKYVDGFWVQNQQYSLPFLTQSYIGAYTSPPLNQMVQS